MNKRLFFLSFFFHTILYCQIQDKVDFKQGIIDLKISLKEKEITGSVTYKFAVLKDVDSIFFDAKSMIFTSVLINDKKARYSNDNKHINIKKRFKKGDTNVVTLIYKVKPKQTVYFIDWNSSNSSEEPNQNQIWTQGQGKYTSYWLPSFDDMNEKVEFDLNITFDKNYTVIANGKLIDKKNKQPDATTWSFDMQKPMSSYLLAFVIGTYAKETIMSASGIPIELYYYPQDSVKVEPTYRYSKQLFDFLEHEIGVSYPWQNYKQIPVKDFLYAGMENTTTTIFSDSYVIDSTSFIDKNYVNVNAHELAHQWFGDMITEVDGNHHWLQEGFATYYALLAEKDIFGDDYFYWKLYDSAESLKEFSKNNGGEALSNNKASSLIFYEKGAWALVMLRNEIGDSAFKKGIQAYLEKYKFKNVTISDFITEMENACGKNLAEFKALWINSTDFQYDIATSYLKKQSQSLSDFFTLQDHINNSNNDDKKVALIENAFQKENSLFLKKNILLSISQDLFSNRIYEEVFASKDIKLRQALTLVTTKISLEHKENYEAFLDDESYNTIENVLYMLFLNFPADRKIYLDKTKDIIGLPDKNVRLLWLTLALVTEDYNSLKTKEYFDELGSYTSPKYSIETRQTAFQYLYQTFGLTDENLKNLANAAVHHSWQFKKFARTLLDELLKDDDYKNRLTSLTPMLNEEEKRYINSKLGL
tara:strand:- start:8508 stop:10616 length:2109 start_codon:yes stop_codon:yes gene_type:complete